MADDNIKSTVVRKARVSFVKDNIQNIIHYETDADCVKNLNTAIVNGVSNVFNNDDTIKDIITNIATEGVDLSNYAKLDSPSFTGEPKTPTPVTSDNSLKLANTEYVNKKISELQNTTASKTDLNNYVTKTGNDTITGLKTFNTDINTVDSSTIYWKTGTTTVASINKSNYTGTSDKAVKDQNGNIINSTYATKAELNTKQNTLTFDTTPKSGSTNPVTSGGVYDAIKNSGSVSVDGLATVAKTGSYTDLINTPSLATDTTLGFTKLYSSSGSRSDGTITQAGITELLSYKLDRENLEKVALTGEFGDLYNIPVANDSTQGITKLYSTLGDNTDGAISQYGINNILANYAKTTDIMSVYRYKGSVDNYSDLPTNHKAGDVYNIKNADSTNNIKAGDNVVWSGTEWDNLSGIVDLTAYKTKDENDKLYLAINGKATSATKADQATYLDIVVNSSDGVERYIPFCHSSDAVVNTSPTKTRIVYDKEFTYQPTSNTLKVGDANNGTVTTRTIIASDNTTTKELSVTDTITSKQINNSDTTTTKQLVVNDTTTTKNMIVSGTLTIPGGKIWIE